MKKTATVSLCLITKDEAATILACLNSARSLVDEMILVDTGSTDPTVDLARSVGAAVYSFPWSGDFARARNFALEQAAGDWILILDADEVLAPVPVNQFARLLAVPDISGYFLTIKNYLGSGEKISWDQVVRLFRNRPQYRFEGTIHEQVAPSILRDRGNLAYAPLEIHHYGYLDQQVIKKDKYHRNISIIKRELASKQTDPFLLYCLSVEYYQRGLVTEGLTCLDQALVQMRGSEGYFADVIRNRALGLLAAGRLTQLISFTGKSLAMLPDQPDLLVYRGLGHLQLQQCREALPDFSRALELGGSPLNPQFQIYSWLADAYLMLGDYTRAGEAYLLSWQANQRFLYPLNQIINLLKQQQIKLRSDNLNLVDYAGITVREMYTCMLAGAKGYDHGLFPLKQKFDGLVEQLTLLFRGE